MRIFVLLKSEPTTAQPRYTISIACAAMFERAGDVARPIRPGVIQLKTNESLSALKARLLRPRESGYVPQIGPPREPFNLELVYPARDLRSGNHPVMVGA